MVDRRRKDKLRRPDNSMAVLVSEPGSRFAARLEAVVVNRSELGMCLAVPKALPLGMGVEVEFASDHGAKEIWSGIVCWMSPHPNKGYWAGIEAEPKGKQEAPLEGEEDLYELLQVNPKADFDTIHRVYRMLAQRYHPDHKESGDPDKFRRVIEAYRVLSDLEKRAAYDVKRAAALRQTWDVFRNPKEADGTGAERRKRTMVLAMMYRARQRKPASPYVQLREIEEVLGIEKEHLEFSLWYLREKGYIMRTDNGRYAISAMGAEAYEEDESSATETPRRAIEGSRQGSTQ
ncbi:MAG: J domain-containing protein [Acidobacteriota bacterium]